MAHVVTMCIGDSITLGLTTKRGGWRRLLNDRAPNLAMVGRNCVDATNGDTVGQHEGYGGRYVASHLSTGIVAAVDSYAPSLVILMLGTNDLYYDGLGGAAATLANVVAFAETLLARSSVTHVLACNIAPFDPASLDEVDSEPGELVYPRSVTFRSGFAAAFSGASAGIATCDPWSTCTNPGADFSDSLHPSEAGYAKAAPIIYNALRSMGIRTDLDAVPRRSPGYALGYV